MVNKDVDNVLDLSLRPSVCSFVRLLPTCERYTSKTNEPISIKLSINLAPPGGGGKDTNGRPRVPGGQRSRSQEAKVVCGSLAETSFSNP